jgi:methionyl-tRNA formyltransferase
MRVVFFGTPSFAAPTLAALIESPHEVAAVVTQPDRARGRGQKVTHAPVKALALAHNLPVLQPGSLKSEETLSLIRSFSADIGVVAAYGKILPQSLLDLFPRGLINVHASLLPRWRGAAPIHRAIQAGDRVTGVTIMRVVLALDAGPMLSRVEVPIDPNITSDALEAVLAAKGAGLLVETLATLERGTASEAAQDDSQATYARKIERADGQIDWTRSAREIHNQIRAMQPWPMASAMFAGKRVILRSSVVHADDAPGMAPGAIVEAGGDMLRVATGAGILRVTSLQVEGGRPQSAREFINGFRPRPQPLDLFTKVEGA